MDVKAEDMVAFAKVVWGLVERYGPGVESFISEMVRSLTPVEGVTFCGRCGAESPVFSIDVGGKRFFRGKCPTHGFDR